MKIFEKKNETKLLSSIAINKIGNVMYDYGNSTWIAGLGAIGQKYMGYYQLAENVISLILNPIGGAVADRFQRRKILLVTDFIGGLMCALLALIGNDNIMLYGLIAVNAILAMTHAFSGTSFKSYVATIVDEDRLAAFNYLAPFSNQLFCDSSSYATLLSMGAAGSIAGAVLANKFFKNSYNSILIALALCGVGLSVITVFAVLGLPAIVIVFGNFLFESFLTIFNIHFFSMVQKQVPNHMLGRVFSSIFTVAILFMPLSTAIMTALPFSVSIYTFAIIGVGVILVSICGFFYSKLVLC